MPHPTFLHIQTRDAERIMALAGASVRIGQGPQCEVRLEGDNLAEVQCLLRRRGETWHLQPLEPSGRLTIDGRPVETQRPLAHGEALRVGDHWLTLRAGEGPRRLGSFEAPIPVAGVASTGPVAEPAAFVSRSYDDPTTTLRPNPFGGDEHDRLRRWEAQLERRERWLKARQDEHRWEARWRAAGEALRARALKAEPSTPPADPAPIAAPPEVANESVEASPTIPLPNRLSPSVEENAVLPTELSTGMDADQTPTSLIPAPAEPIATAEEPTDATLLSTDTIDLEPPSVAVVPIPTTVPDVPAPSATSFPASVFPDPSAVVARGPIGDDEDDADDLPTRPTLGVCTMGARVATDTSFESSEWDVSAATGWGPSASDARSWPTAARILDGVGPRRAAFRSAHRPAVRPEPTVGHAPDAWSVPLWLAGLPAVLAACVLAAVGLGLAWTWMQDDRASRLVADRIVGRDRLPREPIVDRADLPEPSWWNSTADHLYLQAVAVGAAAESPDDEEYARFLLGLARNAAPSHAGVRFALAQGRGDGAADRDLALSRDVVALTLSARSRLRAGSEDEALALYGEALAMALAADPARLPLPSFDGEESHRFRLPGDDLLTPIVEELAGHAGWSFSRWSECLPRSPRASWVAHCVLRERHDPAAEQALDRALAAEPDDAVGLAAKAEALAARERWSEAEACYRDAIARMSDDRIGRSWWLNLATIVSRLDDPTPALATWDRAKSSRTGDPIMRRLAEARAHASGLQSGPETAAVTRPSRR